MNIRLSGTIGESIVDGPGIRYVIFTQGCPHKCIGCHNPETHDASAGFLKSTDDILSEIKQNPLLDGVTFSGGEPFMQSDECLLLAKSLKKMGLNIFCYTGFLYEHLLADKKRCDFLKECDVLIDGKFEINQKNLMLNFKGSDNQRIIDVQKSLIENVVVLKEW